MLAIKADTSSILKQAKKLQSFGDKFAPKAKKACAAIIKKSIDRCFEQARSPYGQNWRATLAGNKPLSGSGKLKASIRVQISGETIKVSSGVFYAGVHQSGATINAKKNFLTFNIGGAWARKAFVTIPARPFLPDKGLPNSWVAEINDELIFIANDLLG